MCRTVETICLASNYSASHIRLSHCFPDIITALPIPFLFIWRRSHPGNNESLPLRAIWVDEWTPLIQIKTMDIGCCLTVLAGHQDENVYIFSLVWNFLFWVINHRGFKNANDVCLYLCVSQEALVCFPRFTHLRLLANAQSWRQ